MSDPTATLGDKLAKIARVVLLTAIAAVLALIIFRPQNSGPPNPFSVGRAQAEGICAAPGYLLLTIKQGSAAKFYICDTEKKVFCVYETIGDKIRLVSARKFDEDVRIFDASISVNNLHSPEGRRPGLTRADAKIYADAISQAKEKAEKKKP
jgi:hypothetical protein